RVVARAVSLSSRLLSVLLSVPTRRSSDLGAGQGDRGVLGTFPGAGERAVGGDHFRCRGSPGDLGVVLALGWQVEIIDRRLGDLDRVGIGVQRLASLLRADPITAVVQLGNVRRSVGRGGDDDLVHRALVELIGISGPADVTHQVSAEVADGAIQVHRTDAGPVVVAGQARGRDDGGVHRPVAVGNRAGNAVGGIGGGDTVLGAPRGIRVEGGRQHQYKLALLI